MLFLENILISIAGPTAIGKTSLSIALANYFKTEIVSCDSRQFYKEMTIGTAVPSSKELSSAPHHFIQDRSIFEAYNVGEFERDALQKLTELFKKHTIVILVGGSGLYLDAVLKGLDDFPEIDASIRKHLNTQLKEGGLKKLQAQLKELDPKTYESIAIDNPHRLIRSLEICLGTGLPYSSFKNKKKTDRNFRSIQLGLNADRQVLYDRINQRVDLMLTEGLEAEAQKLYQHKDLNALQTVGYKEFFAYFDGTISKEFAIEEIKKNSRRFAKRQLTWFRKNKEINWFDFEAKPVEICKKVEELIKNKTNNAQN